MTAHAATGTFYAHIIYYIQETNQFKSKVVEIKLILKDRVDSTICYSIDGNERRWSHTDLMKHWRSSPSEASSCKPYLS